MRDCFCGDDEIVSRADEAERVLLNSDEMKLRGRHNVENVLAALAAGLACGAAPESMRETIRNFAPVEHRLEFVAEIDGVKFYNDSKATSVDATLKALEAFADDAGKIILILGGRGKKAPYAPLASLVEKKVRKLVLIGEDAETIERELGNLADTERAADMSEAVSISFASRGTGRHRPACSGLRKLRHV